MCEMELLNGEYRGNNARLQLNANCLTLPESAQTTNFETDTHQHIFGSSNRAGLLNKIHLGPAPHTQR